MVESLGLVDQMQLREAKAIRMNLRGGNHGSLTKNASLSRHVMRRGFWKRTHLLHPVAAMMVAFCAGQFSFAETLDIGTSADFLNAIQAVDTNPDKDYTLNFLNNFTMTQQSLNIASDSVVKLAGNSKTVDGNSLFQPLVINKGTLELHSFNVINAGQPVTVNGGTLVDKTGSLKGDVLNNGVVAFDSPNPLNYSGNMSGNGSVQILGEGPVTFIGTNTYSDGTYIAEGASLTGTTSSLQGNFLNFGKLEFNQDTAGTYSGSIYGHGGVVISGSGPVTFTGLNAYDGGTLVNAGSTLIGSTDSLQGPILTDGTVQFDQQQAGTFKGTFLGTGHVQISGSGPITFTAPNSHTGGTSIDTGSTLIGTTANLHGAIENDGTVEFNQVATGAFSGNISGSGKVLISGSGPVVFTGLNSYTGGTTTEEGSTLLGTAKSLHGTIHNEGSVQFIAGGNGTYSGDMSGKGSLTVAMSAAINLTGNNTYTGGTKVEDGGTLIGNASSLQGSIDNDGTLVFKSIPSPFQLQQVTVEGPSVTPPIYRVAPGYLPPVSNIFEGAISGSGHVEVEGPGITAFTGQNTYIGGTTVKSGATLAGSTRGIQGNITNNGFVQFNNSLGLESMTFPSGSDQTGEYSGNMSGTGGVEISGITPIRFTGTNTYTGGTYIDHGSSLIGTTNSVQGAIANDGLVTFDQNFGSTYAGNMAGSGAVLITGAGPVTFSGTNTYLGGTAIHADSTLIGTTSSLQGAIDNSGLLRFHQSTSGLFTGTISGDGDVEIAGTGPVVFQSLNTYTGTTTVGDGSTLIVNGSIVGAVDVENGAKLMGAGKVGDTTIKAGGTIASGTIGSPLTIQGDLTQKTGSSYVADLNATGSDLIIVKGTAEIESGTKLNLNLGNSVLNVGKTYELLRAEEGIEGHYDGIFATQTNQLITFSPDYSDDKITLTVTSNLSPYAGTTNQRILASVIDYSSGSATGDYADAITHLTLVNPRGVQYALNQLSADLYPSLTTIEKQTSTVQLQLISNRLARLKSPGVMASAVAQTSSPLRLVSSQANEFAQGHNPAGVFPPATSPWSTWAQGYGLGGSISSDGNAGGSNYRLGGTLFGVERWLGERFLVGLLGGYAGTSVDNGLNSSTAQINSYQVGLYELIRGEEAYLSNMDFYGNNNYDLSRPMNLGDIHRTATGTSRGNQWSHYTEGGINLDFDELRLQPFIGFQYVYIDQQGVNESGAGSLSLRTDGQSINSVRNSFGARVYDERMWGDVLFVPSFAASYQHEWGNGTQMVSSSFAGAPTVQFATAGNSTGRDFGLLSLNGTAYFTDRFSVYAAVDGQFATRYSAVIGSGGLQYSW
ncbi:autotransporter domain-containing protein [Schlesneria sp. T3-172]|uniref:autotransporter domain-containing protein n=1 Tax=Schlesneria sphaerica TaxID=3373610 RepID=UPI0037C83897